MAKNKQKIKVKKDKIENNKKIPRSRLDTAFAIIAILAVILNLIMLEFFRAEFFDIFGLLVWVFFLIFGAWMLLTKEETPDWLAWVVVIIGLLGLITDGWIVIKTFLIKG